MPATNPIREGVSFSQALKGENTPTMTTEEGGNFLQNEMKSLLGTDMRTLQIRTTNFIIKYKSLKNIEEKKSYMAQFFLIVQHGISL